MTDQLTGVESALITEFNGWDGDFLWMMFYEVTLRPEVAEAIGVNANSKVDLSINLEGFFNEESVNFYASNSDEVIAVATPVLDGLTIKFEFEVM